MENQNYCIKGSKKLKSAINGKDGNDGGNEYLYYYFYDGKLGCSPNKPIKYTETTKVSKFIEQFN